MRASAAAVELCADSALLACSSLWDLYRAATGRHVEFAWYTEVSMLEIHFNSSVKKPHNRCSLSWRK